MIEDSALILIEFQQEWLHTNGKLNRSIADRGQFHTTVQAAQQALVAARHYDMPVVHCGLRFQDGYPELGNAIYGMRESIARLGSFAIGSPGSQFAEPFAPQAREFIVQGRTGSSGFAGSNLDSYLRNQGITQLYLAGFALHLSIESTLRQGHDLGYTVTVLEDACAAFNAQQRQHVLEDVVHHFGRRMTVDELIYRMEIETYSSSPRLLTYAGDFR